MRNFSRMENGRRIFCAIWGMGIAASFSRAIRDWSLRKLAGCCEADLADRQALAGRDGNSRLPAVFSRLRTRKELPLCDNQNITVVMCIQETDRAFCE